MYWLCILLSSKIVPILFLLPALVYFLQVIQPVLLFYLSSPWFSPSSNDPLLSSSDTMIGLSGVVSFVLICLIYFLFFLYIWPSSVLIMKLLRSWHLLGQLQVLIDHISASPPFHQYVNHQMVLHIVCSAFFDYLVSIVFSPDTWHLLLLFWSSDLVDCKVILIAVLYRSLTFDNGSFTV